MLINIYLTNIRAIIFMSYLRNLFIKCIMVYPKYDRDSLFDHTSQTNNQTLLSSNQSSSKRSMSFDGTDMVGAHKSKQKCVITCPKLRTYNHCCHRNRRYPSLHWVLSLAAWMKDLSTMTLHSIDIIYFTHISLAWFWKSFNKLIFSFIFLWISINVCIHLQCY